MCLCFQYQKLLPTNVIFSSLTSVLRINSIIAYTFYFVFECISDQNVHSIDVTRSTMSFYYFGFDHPYPFSFTNETYFLCYRFLTFIDIYVFLICTYLYFHFTYRNVKLEFHYLTRYI